MLALGAQNFYKINYSSHVGRWLLVSFSLCIGLKRKPIFKKKQVNTYPPLNAFIGGFTLGNLNNPIICSHHAAARKLLIILKTKKWPWWWLSCHLNWLRCDQVGLHFRAMQSNTRHRNSPQTCHSVCSHHVPHKGFPAEAKIVLTEEVCVDFCRVNRRI